MAANGDYRWSNPQSENLLISEFRDSGTKDIIDVCFQEETESQTEKQYATSKRKS